MKKYIFPALISVFAVVFLISAAVVLEYVIESKKQKDQYNDLSNIVQQIQQQQPGNNQNNSAGDNTPNLPSLEDVEHPKTGEHIKVLREYVPILERNSDLVGWLKIPGTRIDYPVLQTPDSPNFYLTRDFYKKDSRHGAIYVCEYADVNAPSDNVTIYGHKMKDGSMFSDLFEYMDKDFYLEHSQITFDTLTERHTYQIVAAFLTTAAKGGFGYHRYVDGDAALFDEYIAKCKELSLYDTGVTAQYGDKLITLSTCYLGIDDGRFVVVAKRIQ